MKKKIRIGAGLMALMIAVMSVPVHAENRNIIIISMSDDSIGTDTEALEDGTIFDYGYYAVMYEDVVNALGRSHEALLDHYLTYGKNEGRYPNAYAALAGHKYTRNDIEVLSDGTVFDYGYYAMKYPDVTAALGISHDALKNHYLTFGKNEGRFPNAEAAGEE